MGNIFITHVYCTNHRHRSLNCNQDKKAFLEDVNRPFAKSWPNYKIPYEYEQVQTFFFVGVEGGPCTVRSKWSKFVQVRSGQWSHGTRPLNRQTDTTENITFPQLRWRAVNMLIYVLRHETAVFVKQKFAVLIRSMKRKTSFDAIIEMHAAFLLRKKAFSLAHTVHMSNSVGGISVTVSDIWYVTP